MPVGLSQQFCSPGVESVGKMVAAAWRHAAAVVCWAMGQRERQGRESEVRKPKP